MTPRLHVYARGTAGSEARQGRERGWMEYKYRPKGARMSERETRRRPDWQRRQHHHQYLYRRLGKETTPQRRHEVRKPPCSGHYRFGQQHLVAVVSSREHHGSYSCIMDVADSLCSSYRLSKPRICPHGSILTSRAMSRRRGPTSGRVRR